MLPQQYCLRWKHHHTNVQSMFSQLLEKERFCDVTLYCSPSFGASLSQAKTAESGKDNYRGVSLRAHRVVLAACSELLASLLGAHDSDGGTGPSAEPVLVIDGAEPKHLRALLDYMYTGEMNVHHRLDPPMTGGMVGYADDISGEAHFTTLSLCPFTFRKTSECQEMLKKHRQVRDFYPRISQLASLLKTAEELRIKGLSDIRWSGKDEPPDSKSGAVTATPTAPERMRPATVRDTYADSRNNVNGGPPPLIKLPAKPMPVVDKSSPAGKRDLPIDIDGPNAKRQRVTSRSDNTDEEDRATEHDWHHGNMDISAEKVKSQKEAATEGDNNSVGSWESDGEEEWGDTPHDMASFLHTNLQVDGDNSNDDDATDNGNLHIDIKPEVILKPISQLMNTPKAGGLGLASCTKSSPTDPRFSDVIKLNEYLLHGRRPQFWEEDYVRRVMEAVRLKELEMKQAAEILGVSYGTLYGRYRDVYGCINRPYRMKDFWTEQGPAEVLMRLQRGECTLGAAAEALNVSPNNLAAYLSGLQPLPTVTIDDDNEFEPIPIEGDPEMRKPNAAPITPTVKSIRKNVAAAEKAVKKILIGSLSSDNEDNIPVSIINQRETRSTKPGQVVKTYSAPSSGIRVASIDSLRTQTNTTATDTMTASPSSLMRSRPDLTIVASTPKPSDT